MRLLIKNGRVIDPLNQVDKIQDLMIAEGKIIQTTPDFKPDQIIDASSLVVCPGLIDLSGALSTKKFNKCQIEEEMALAAASGITTLCLKPLLENTQAPAPLFLDPFYADLNKLKVVQLGAITKDFEGKELNDLASLQKLGFVGVTNNYNPITDIELKRRCYQYAQQLGLKVFVFPQDYWLAKKGCMHEGDVSFRLGLNGIPSLAESVAVCQELLLIEETGVDAHFCRLSAAQSLDLLRTAKKKHLRFTADVAIRQLHLTEIDVSNYNSLCHVDPPLRTQTDRFALQLAIKDQTVNAICSDHAIISTQDKATTFAQTRPGMPGFETLLPLTLRLVASEQPITLMDALSLLTCKPAEILGINQGSISPGKPADICIFDPTHRWVLSNDTLGEEAKTPFAGWELEGKVRYTLLNGKITYRSRLGEI